jgi:hypothetical protein
MVKDMQSMNFCKYRATPKRRLTALTRFSASLVFLAITAWCPAALAVWPVSGGGPENDEVVEIVTSPTGAVYVAGHFKGAATFDEIFNVQSFSPDLNDIYVAKFSPVGQLEWVVTAGGISEDQLTGLAVDGSDNAYVTGTFFGDFSIPIKTISTEFDGETGDPTSRQAGFVAKVSAGGEWQWLTGLRGRTANNSDDGKVTTVGLATVKGRPAAGTNPPTPGSVIVAGSFTCTMEAGENGNFPQTDVNDTDPVNFDGRVDGVCGGNRTDLFFARLTQDGSWKWAFDSDGIEGIDPQGLDAIEKMAVDDNGNIYFVYTQGQEQAETDLFFDNFNNATGTGGVALDGGKWNVLSGFVDSNRPAGFGTGAMRMSTISESISISSPVAARLAANPQILAKVCSPTIPTPMINCNSWVTGIST